LDTATPEGLSEPISCQLDPFQAEARIDTCPIAIYRDATRTFANQQESQVFNPNHPRPSRRHRRDAHDGPDGHGGHGNPFGWSGEPFTNPFERFGHGRPGGHGVRRGEIRPLILGALRTRPMHGYEIIQELEAQSGGRWRPSAGSVYPSLQQLADEGLVTSEEVAGRRTYTLTDAGQAAADAVPQRGPWSGRRGEGANLRGVGLQLIGAVMQVQKVGSADAQREALRILTDARRQVYRLLAEDDVAADAEPTTDARAATADDDATA
jgi:DNA-binding PadR family transcriptional regulator